ncbi:MAG: hypothetical protein MSC31_18735 [Solirubrobacteraceae bacterium MAG38_C4-C5]|nr:hypothetical protein [Candidatus Siliceabacter maunaloa]
MQFATLFGANAYIGQADIGTTMIDVHHVTQYDGAVERSPAVTRTEGLGGLGVHSDRVADA